MSKICGYNCEHNKGGVCQITSCDKKIVMTTITEPQTLTRWKDPTIDDLIKENLKLKRQLGEADDTVEYWQIECDKRSEVLDKIKEYIEENACYDKDIKQCCRDLLTDECDYVLELLEEIE